MSASSSRSELRDVIDFFKAILRIQAKPIHYRELSIHYMLFCSKSKSFFHSFKDSEKFAFFRDQFKTFRINGNGFVTCTEDDVIEAFTELLKNSASQHFLKVINATEVATIYFKSSSVSEQFKFFKDHSQFFSIKNSGNVKLSKQERAITRVTWLDENEVELLLFFKARLASCGPTYFTWLLDYFLLENSLHHRNVVAMEADMKRSLWEFFKNHPSDFVISDNGFVDLSSHLKSTVKVHAFILEKEDEVIGFFIASLAFFGCVLFPLLLKLLQESVLDIRCFFAHYSLSQIQGFFTKHSNTFISQGKYISLQHTDFCDEFIHFEGNSYPFEEQQEVVFFFLDNLATEKCPKHYIHLSQVLEESNIENGFKHAFVGCPASIKHWFFKSNAGLFCIEGSGYVSLHSLVKLSDVGKRAVLHFAKKLKISSVEHFFTLVTSAEVSSTEFQNYFASFSPLYKFYFFKKFPAVFSVDVNGYVSCKVVPNLFPEAEVINMLIKKLEISQPIHFEKLCLSVENSSEVAMEFFQTYSVSEKHKFFKSKPMHFCIKSDGYVCLPVSSSALKDSVPGNISKSNHTSTDIAHDSTHVVSKTNGVQYSPATSCSDCTTGGGSYTSEHICAYKLSSGEGNAQYNPFVSLSDSLPTSISNTIKYVCSEADDSQHRPSISHVDSSSPSITNNFEYFASETNVARYSSAASCTDSTSVSTADTSKHVSSKADDVQYSPILHQFSHSDSASVSIIAIPEHVSCETNVEQHSSAASCTDSSSVSTADTSEHVSSKAADVQYSPTSSNNSDSASVNITALPERVSSETSGVQYSPAASDSDSSSVCIANAHVSSGVSDAQSDSIVLISSSSPLNSEDSFMHVTAETIAIEHNSTVSCSDNLPVKATTTVTPISSNNNDVSCSSAVPYNAMAIYNTDRNDKSNMLVSNTESSNENSDLKECFTLDSQDILKNDVDFTFSESMSHTNEQHPAHKLLNEGKSESKEASENNPEVQIETCIPNSFEMLHNVSNSVKNSPVLTRPSCELRSDAENLEGTPKIDQVIKSLIDELKIHKRIHFEKLCSSNEVSNYFLLYSVKEKWEFFKNHKEYFFVGMDAYVSIPEHTQNTGSIPLLPSNHLGLHENTSQAMLVSSSENTMNREQNTSISPSTHVCITEKPLTPCASHNSLETSNVHSALKNNSLLSQSHVSAFNNPSNVKQSSTKDDERIIILLKHHLNNYKRMHCLELCKVAKKHFKTHSDSEKFRFFKDRPQHFCIDNDSYVTFPSDTAAQCKSNIPVKSLKAVVAGNPSEVGKKRGKKEKQREIIAKLVSVLEEKKKVHFTILCSSDETITNYFKTFSIEQKLAFFKSRPQHFFICSETDHVSLPCDNQTSKSHTGVTNLNFAGDVSKSKLTVLPGKMPTDRQKSLKLGSSDDSGSYVTFPSDTVAQCKINIPGKNLKAVVAGNASEVGKKKKSAEIIFKLMSVLEEKKKVHFTKLCSSDETIENYFKIFTIKQKFEFFKSRPRSFFICPKGGYVSLPCDNQTSKSHIGVVNLNFAGDVSESKLTVLPGKIPTDWRKSSELGNIDNSNSSSKVHERCSTTKTGVSDIEGHADQDSIDTSRSSVSNIVSSMEKANVIEVLTCYLKLCNHMHYLELFDCVEKLNRDFFTPKFPLEKLAFLKRYPNHFHVSADNYVSLPKSRDFSFNITSDANAASPISSKYQCISENEVLNVPVHDQILSSSGTNGYLSHGANQSTQAITIAPSQNELKEKSTLACESKHVHNSKSDNPDAIVNAATQSKISRSHNPEASNSIVTDDDRVMLVPYRTHEAEPGIFVDNPNPDIKNAVKQIYKSDANCGRRFNALRLKMSETESELQCNRSDFGFDHQEEMVRTLVSQLKTCKRVHFLKLYESCENVNQTFKRVFYFFANYEKLEFLKSHPQCFVVDDAGFVTAPIVGRASSATSILGKEALESRYSSPCNNTDRQAESIGDPEDSGGGSYLSSDTEEGFNNALQTNSVAEIAENDEVSLANTLQYDTFRPLMGHRSEIIKTFVDRLKIGRCMYFTKLCKSAEKRNGTVKKFFHSFLDSEKLEFLKSCPQYFSVDSNGFVTLSPMTKSKVSTFVPCEESSKSISSNLHENENKHSGLATSHNDANTVSRCITPNNEQSIDPSFKFNSEEERSLNALTSVASVTEKIILEDLDTKGLLNFFQSILRTAGSLHYEELFIELEDSRVFRNYRTLFEQFGKLKFFKDHPDIFTIQSGGFISLIAEADSKSCPIKDVYKKTTWKEIGVITDNEKSKSCDYTCAHEKLSLNHWHMYIIGHFIKALQENQPLHFKQLVKDACIANHDAKFFFALFKTSADLLDFCKLHSMYFTIDDEEMVSLRRSDIMLDEAFSLGMELREIKSSIISKALEFYTTLLKSSDNLSIKEAESELQFAPGYVISFINTNYPGSKIIYFFIDHPHHFLLDDEGKIALRTNETDTKNLLENTVIANDITKNNDMPLKPENVYPSKVKIDYKFHPSIQDHSAVSLRLPENHEVPLKVQNSGNLLNIPDGNEASSSVLNENNDHLKEHADLSTISRLPLQSVPLSLSKFVRSSSLVNPDQQQKSAHKPKFQGETVRKQLAKRNKVKQQLLDVCQLRTEIQPSNAIKQSTHLVTLPVAMRCKSDTVHHSMPSNIIDHNNADVQRMKLVDQDVQNAVDAESQFPPRPPVREALKQLATLAKTFNPELEMECVDFFRSVMRKKAHRVLHVKFLRAIASKSPDAIRPYLLQYGKEDFPLFFYLHLEHFLINSLGYVALRMVPNRTGCDNELEVKASNFFTTLIHFTFKGRASCDVLERCLHFASEEVKLYLSKTYKTNLKLFFCNHADHFDIDVFDNVSLKH